jgi:hypothetical protein
MACAINFGKLVAVMNKYALGELHEELRPKVFHMLSCQP